MPPTNESDVRALRNAFKEAQTAVRESDNYKQLGQKPEHVEVKNVVDEYLISLRDAKSFIEGRQERLLSDAENATLKQFAEFVDVTPQIAMLDTAKINYALATDLQAKAKPETVTQSPATPTEHTDSALSPADQARFKRIMAAAESRDIAAAERDRHRVRKPATVERQFIETRKELIMSVFDTDGKGSISSEEFTAKIDPNKDGRISAEELAAFNKTLPNEAVAESVANVMRLKSGSVETAKGWLPADGVDDTLLKPGQTPPAKHATLNGILKNPGNDR